MRFGLIGPSYLSESQNVDCELLINRYLEINEAGPYSSPPAIGTPGREASAPTRWSAFMRPGKALMGSIGSGPGSCLVSADADPVTSFDGTTPQCFAIVGTDLVAIAFTPGAVPGVAITVLGTVAVQPIIPRPGQNLPNQIIVINPNLICACANGIFYVAGREISGSAVSFGGAGYAVNDTGTILGGANDAAYTVTSVDGSGAVTGFTIASPAGHGYQITFQAGTTPHHLSAGLCARDDRLAGRSDAPAVLCFGAKRPDELGSG